MAQRENSAVPASGLAVVVALLFGYLALHETTLERYRPPKTEKSSDQLIDLQDADARLWQDPFAAVQRHVGCDLTQDLFRSDALATRDVAEIGGLERRHRAVLALEAAIDVKWRPRILFFVLPTNVRIAQR